jgi:hypothetical protein
LPAAPIVTGTAEKQKSPECFVVASGAINIGAKKLPNFYALAHGRIGHHRILMVILCFLCCRALALFYIFIRVKLIVYLFCCAKVNNKFWCYQMLLCNFL